MLLSIQVQEEVLEEVQVSTEYNLVVFNDDVNTFDHVIDTLISVCDHSMIQAEQCTNIIHYNGKCTVKTGEFDYLKELRTQICDAGISAEVMQ